MSSEGRKEACGRMQNFSLTIMNKRRTELDLVSSKNVLIINIQGYLFIRNATFLTVPKPAEQINKFLMVCMSRNMKNLIC